MVPALYLMIGTFFLPESPRWLAKKDRWEECHEILTMVHGKGDRDNQLVVVELEQIKAACEIERQFGDVTYWELFKPKMLNRTIIGAFDQIWCQLTGMNLMSMSTSSTLLVLNEMLTILQCTTLPTYLAWRATRATPICWHHPSST